MDIGTGIAIAAICYAQGDTVRDLVKAGALIAAEIDRRIKWKIK